MRRATILLILAMVISGTLYFSNLELAKESLPYSPSVSESSSRSASSEDLDNTQPEEAIWQKLGDRLARRMAPANKAEPTPGSPSDESEPVFDTRADWLAAAGVTVEEEAEALKWAFERGFETHSLGYEFYDRDTLKALADSGDIFALQRLADHAAWSEEQFVRAEVLYREAAARGSVLAVDRLVVNEMAKAVVAKQGGERESAKRHLLKAWAWSKVSKRRVGEMPAPAPHEEQIRRQLKQIDVTLGDADFDHIEAQGETLYQALMEARADLGLDEFDNSTPRLFEKLKRHGLENAAIRNP